MIRISSWLSAALTLFLVAADPAFAAGPVNPHGVMVAGASIIAVDEDLRLWRRGQKEQDLWSVVEIPEAPNARVSGLTCAQDGSGRCLVKLAGDRPKDVIYDADTGQSEALDLKGGEAALFADKTQIYYLTTTGGVRTLFLYKVQSKTSEPYGTVAANELVRFFGIDGVVQPVALSNAGVARALRPAGKSVTVRMPFSESLIVSKGQLILPEEWYNDRPITPGRQTISVIELGTADATTGAVGVRGGPILALSRDRGVLTPQSLRVDSNQDLLGQFASAEGRTVGVLCNAEKGRGFAFFMKPPLEALVEISGSGAGPGFIFRAGDLMSSGSYRYLSFPAADQGYRSRKCADLKLSAVDLGIEPRTAGAEFEKVHRVATTADGAQTPFTIFRQKGVAPKHLIIDVYGAYGSLVGREPFPKEVLAWLKETGTAVATPIVRGDGNLGYERGVASRTPNRSKAVEDAVAVAEKLKAEYPGLRPLIRGRSAGGWLAVRSALERPDLFSGAVGASGAYKLSGLQALSEGSQRFFAPEDDLGLQSDKLKAACPQLKFRFLHAKDDWKLPYADAEAFADLVRRAGCSVELVSFETGGHNLDIPISQAAEGMRRMHAFYDPF